MKSLINRKIAPNDFYLIETSYRLNNENTKYEYNKYVHSLNDTPLSCFCRAFDTNNKADYRLIKTINLTYFSVMENKFVQFLVFDFSRTYNLVFLGEISQQRAKPYMLIKNRSKYSIISTKDDLDKLDNIRTYSLSQAIRTLSNGDSHLFDFTLDRQYVIRS